MDGLKRVVVIKENGLILRDSPRSNHYSFYQSIQKRCKTISSSGLWASYKNMAISNDMMFAFYQNIKKVRWKV